MNDTLAGGLFGMGATLIGAWVAHQMTVASEDRKAARQHRAQIRTLSEEIRGHLRILEQEDATPVPLAGSAYDTLKAGGQLAELPLDLVRDVVALYTKYCEINDQVGLLRTLLAAMHASGAGEGPRRGLQGFFDTIRDLKKDAKGQADRCLASLEKAA